MDLSDAFAEVCEKAVRAAGRLLCEKLGRVTVREKGQADLVTEADLAAQEIVRQTVLGAFADHCLLGEEDRPGAARQPRTEFRWIVDPLDGTTNYVHGVPHFCVSLALERNGELLVGAIHDPMRDECFLAAREQGAWLNHTRIRTSAVSRPADALVGIGFPAVVRQGSPDLQVFYEAAVHCQGVRRTGSAALNLAYVAAGRFDACWSFSTKPWDAAAGALLIREAGGTITDPSGEPYVLDRGHFLAASTGVLHGELRNLIARAAR